MEIKLKLPETDHKDMTPDQMPIVRPPCFIQNTISASQYAGHTTSLRTAFRYLYDQADMVTCCFGGFLDRCKAGDQGPSDWLHNAV